MFALTGNSDINTSLQERFAGASPGEASLQDARTLKPLKLDDQHEVQEGLTQVESERQNSAVHQISYGNGEIVPIYNEKCMKFKVTRPSFLGGVPSYFEVLWCPHLYFYRKFNTQNG